MLFYDTATRQPSGNSFSVGSLPDMLSFTHDGSKLLVANEATPNAAADTAYLPVDPAGSVRIIDMGTRTVTPALFQGVPTSGSNLRLPTATGMDYEPEYIAIDDEGAKAFVTLQDANGIAVLDLISQACLPPAPALSPSVVRTASSSSTAAALWTAKRFGVAFTMTAAAATRVWNQRASHC